jgi:leucyl-tRNA synthetase
MQTYNHKTTEPKWQKRWADEKLYDTPDHASGKENYYLLTEFSYPSGTLHVGHWYAFAVPDILARKKRMEGHNVLYPAGFDALGLPAENAAIKRGVDPRVWTYENIARMREQLRSMGASFDWSREVVTADPEYYRWTQWLFVKLFEAGLAERKKAPVNWCPSCETALANEQVRKQPSAIGHRPSAETAVCERCETPVEQKELKQWFLKITKYADRLLADLEWLDWPEEIKEAQKNWIGRSEGALFQFPISNFQFPIDVFTTRPDTLFGATYLVLAPEHEFLSKIKNSAVAEAMADKQNSKLQFKIQNWDEIKQYIDRAKRKTELERLGERGEKTGVELKGIKAINPASGEEIPIWVADYVLAHVGTGAVMGVPAHDERDFEFAKKYNLSIRNVIEPEYTQTTEPGKVIDNLPFDHRDTVIAIVKHWNEEKYIALKWKKVAWGTFVTGGIERGQSPEEAARMEIREETGYTNLKLSAEFGRVHGKFYHVPKKVNRVAHAHVLYFELLDGAHEVISEEEQDNHDVYWLTSTELKVHIPAKGYLLLPANLAVLRAKKRSEKLPNTSVGR